MSLILNIDTAIDIATASVAKNGVILAAVSNTEQKEHGSFLQPAIKKLLAGISIPINDLDAIAVAAGPGSYTGLRVGMASAKGLCYALNKPLITINTLEILTTTAITEVENSFPGYSGLYCAMIDARRMEVFTALYDQALQPAIKPIAMVLNTQSYANSLLKNHILFFGNGSYKWKEICNHPNALFMEVSNNPLAMSNLAHHKFFNTDFANLAYDEPFYLKEFFEAPPVH